MYTKFFFAFSALALFATNQGAADENPPIGVANFTNCITDSKQGKKEQENLESLRSQMASLIEKTDKESRELDAKLEDAEYLDSLSPKAEEEMRIKQQALKEDLARYQNQFYQVLNHAQYQMVQKMSSVVAEAAKKVAQEKDLDYIINKEACFYVRDGLDMTPSVIGEMDREFERENEAKKLSDASEELSSTATIDTLLEDASLE